MCGIAGIFCYRGNVSLDEDVGRRMVDSLSHRGPDDGGLVVADNMLLGHRRLSIIDLSDDGHQPMSAADERYWLTYNGEIYNFKELRAELELAGHTFRSQTDTEVILRGFLEWREDVLKKLNGMFAFALWDRLEKTLWLVRDPCGIKPLFYHDDGRCLRFGSEIKSILADPQFRRVADWRALHSFFTFGYTPAPHTGFEGIKQLLPGTALRVSAKGSEHVVWYDLPYPDRPNTIGFSEAVEQLELAVQSSVNRQMVSDVPLGGLLSGGLDSSAVVRSMQRAGVGDVETFTIGFDEHSFDESPYAARVAQILKTRHHCQHVRSDVKALLPIMVSHAEEPLADNSSLAFYLLAEFTRQNVTVALSGDGADELLAGYVTYRASQLAPYYRGIPAFLRRGLIEPVVRRLPSSQRKYGWTSMLQRFVNGAAQIPPRDHCSWRQILSDSLTGRLYSTGFQEVSRDVDPIGEYVATLRGSPDWLTPLEQQLHIDLCFHLPNDMLVKVDRMSMAHSLEVRVPLLDQEVIRTCLAIPPRHKRKGTRGKLVLKKMLDTDLPHDVVHRRKGGFLLPMERWMRQEWQPLLRETLDEQFLNECGMFESAQVRRLLDDQASGRGDYAYPLFALLSFALWWKIWIAEQQPSQRNEPQFSPTRIQRLRRDGAG